MKTVDWETIYQNYMDYPVRFNEEGAIETPEGVGLPLQSAAQGDSTFAGVQNLDGPLERELLLEYNSELPDVDSLDIELLTQMPIGLMEVLKVQVAEDHKSYWTLTVDIVKELDDPAFNEEIVEQL